MPKPSKLLTRAMIDGKPVSFFSPPHDEPDFPWVDAEELASAFLDAEAAARLTQHAQAFDGENRTVATAVNGDRIATIICHAMAQGLCGAIDHWNGHAPSEDGGPAAKAYGIAAAVTAADHWPLSFPDIIAAFHNNGGPFMRSMRDEPGKPTAA